VKTPSMRTIRSGVLVAVLITGVGLAGCGGSDDDDSAATDTTESDAGDSGSGSDATDGTASDDTSSDAGSGGNCEASGTITGDVEADLDGAPAFSAFIGEEGSYGITLDDGVALNLLYADGIDVNATLTGPDILLRAAADGIDLALDGSGGSIDADFEGPEAQPGSAHVTVDITCG
jgi:hypothetical protein